MALAQLCIILLLRIIIGVVCQQDGYFLPKNIKPIRYNLTIAPDTFNVDAGLFYGNLNIDIEALENTQNITVHVKSLTIFTHLLTVTDQKRKRRISIAGTSEDKDREFYVIHLKEELEKGAVYMLTFGKYMGTLHNDKAGTFYAKYTNSKNETKYMVITEFEPTDARRTFPCFDEPALKATFILNIIRESSLMSASNEELNYTTSLGHGLYRDTFKETLIMSTYLLAFSISEFKYSRKNDRIRVLVRPDAMADGSTNYILDESVKLLKNLEEYTGIPYAFSKLDLVGVPEEYFLDGAMENWGLVVYNEKYLLCSDASNTMDIQKCATFSGHEFAHQWFGNLVTPKSWHYMWLSEGFAAYSQYFVTALAEPTWRLDEQYIVEEFQSCLRNDIAPLTEPINFIFTDYDVFPSSQIYYYKASAVIRMTEHFLTHDIFVKSIRSYLNRHKFSSTEPSDLIREYQKEIDDKGMNHLLNGMSVHSILLPWLNNIGHPIVTVTRNYDTGTITFSQKTFYKTDETDNNIWPIPLTYYLHNSRPRSFSNTVTDLWLTKENATINSRSMNDWILVNKHLVGYYRVNYDEENWKRLTEFLKSPDFMLIPPTNRAQLLDDAFFLAQCSKLDFNLALNMTVFLRRETDYIPIKSFLTNVIELDVNLSGNPQHHYFKTYIKWLLHEAFTKIGLKEHTYDNHVHKLFRMLLAEWMCKFGDPHCQNFGIEHIRRWRRTGALHISHNLQFHVLCGAVQIATKEEWNFLLSQYNHNKDKSTKTQIVRALSCTDRKPMILNYLNVIFDFNNEISPDDRSVAVGNLMQFSKEGMETVLYYLISQNQSFSSYEEQFNPISMIIALPSRYNRYLDLLKKKHGSSDLPVYFYTDETLSDDELLFMSQASNWLKIHSQAIMERENI